MQSVPHNSENGNPPQSKAPKGTTEEVPEELVQQFYPEARKAITKGDYLRRAWLPRYGHRFYTLIKVLRGHSPYQIKDGEAMCYPSLATIAAECGVSRRTVCNWLARNEEGRFIHPQLGEALNVFLRIVPRTRYDPVGQCRVRSSNKYFVSMSDPVHPDDFEKMREAAKQLALAFLEEQQKEQAREARVRESEARATHSTSFVEQDCTQYAGQALHSVSSAKIAPDRPSLTAISNTDSLRSGLKRESSSGGTIRNGNVERLPNGEETEKETYGDGNQTTQATQSDRIEYRKEEEVPPAASLSSKRAEKQPAPLSERDIAISQAEEYAGGIVYSNLYEMGDRNAGVGTRIIVAAMVDAGVPLEKMGELADLGKRRLHRFQLRGGKVINKAGYYINIMRNLGDEARREFWNVAKLEEKDRRSHERAIQASEAQRRQNGYGYR